MRACVKMIAVARLGLYQGITVFWGFKNSQRYDF